MRKNILPKLLAYSGIALIIFHSCKDDSYLATPPPVADQSFVEEFDTLSAAINRGWVIKNRSEPIGTDVWVQGGTGTAYSSKATNDGFISTTYLSCVTSAPFNGIISNWVISPPVTMQNNDRIIFYTRTNDATWCDRMQVRINPYNTGTECGRGNTVGDFPIKLLDIDSINASSDPLNGNNLPSYVFKYHPTITYPTEWTKFEATVSGLSGPSKGRFAFRYFVPFGGSEGIGYDVLLDSVAYKSAGH